MTADPQHWHYGLMAERWAEFNHSAPEAPFYLQEIARYGQPALDLACGTGRLLIPLLQAGVEVDGCDVSADMLAYCRLQAAQAGFQPHLYQQPMHAFHLPRRYCTILINAAFGLAGSRRNDLDTLRSCYAHLEPGGALVFNQEAEYTSAESWDRWLSERRRCLPEPWPAEGRSRTMADGSLLTEKFRLLDVDPLEQTTTSQVRLEKWRAGELVASYEQVQCGNRYLKNELVLMLQVAGFREISVRGDYQDAPATPDSQTLIFTARRGSD